MYSYVFFKTWFIHLYSGSSVDVKQGKKYWRTLRKIGFGISTRANSIKL